MANLSISKAWDETKGVIASDGRLLSAVALALIGIPSMITAILSPQGMTLDDSAPLWVDFLGFIFMLLALVGQLALIRLALKPSVTVGGAIAHGARRMPVNLLAAIIVALALLALAVPVILLIAPGGTPSTDMLNNISGTGWLLVIALVVVALFVGVRMLMMSPVAAAERAGPIAILKRSWELTAGNFWRLLAFLILFLIAAILIIMALGVVAGSIATIAFGPIERLTPSAMVVGLVQGLFNAAFTTVFALMLTRIYVQLSGRETVENAA